MYKNNQSSTFYNGAQMETAQIYLNMGRDKLIKLCSDKSCTMNDLELPIIQVSPQTTLNERSYKQVQKQEKCPISGAEKQVNRNSMLLDLDAGHMPLLSVWNLIKLYMYSHISLYS